MIDLNTAIKFVEKKNDILTVGELLVDMISEQYESHSESSVYHKYFGGSPSNIAINCKRLGVRANVASAIGKDGFGDYLLNTLQQTGINTNSVQRVNYSTSMVVVNKSKTTPIPIFYRGADYHLEYNEQLEELLLNSNIIHFSCWAISKEPVRSTTNKLIDIAKQNNILIGFDPNYHSDIWAKNEDGIEYVKSIISKVDIVKPSEDDAERLFGSDTPENQVNKFINLGARLVIMTLGKEGALVSNGIETARISSVATDVVDSTGAGDAFWAGFYSSLIKGYNIKEALKLASAVSAYKLKFTGSIADLPNIKEFCLRGGH